MNTCGSNGWPPVNWLGGMPNTGSALITPITGFAVAAARAIARKRREGELLVRVADRGAEVELVARGRDLRFDALQGRRVLGVGVRLRIELLDCDLAAAGLPEFH